MILKSYHKIFLVVLFFSVASFFIFGVYKLESTKAKEKALVEEKIELTRNYANLQFSNPIWHFNKIGIELSAEAFLQDPEISSVKVYSGNGVLLYDYKKEGSPHDLDYLVSFRSFVYNVENEYIGEVFFDLTLYYRQKRIREELWRLAMAAFLIVFFQCVIFYYSLKKIMSPISVLKEKTRMVSQGNLSIDLNLKSKDEFGEFAMDFDQMLNRLKKTLEEKDWAFAQLQDFNVDLESRVEERTFELLEANSRLKDSNNRLEETMKALKSAQIELERSERMVSLTTLITRIAHEINTPLGNAITMVTFLEDLVKKESAETGELENETFSEGLKLLENSLNKIAVIVNGLKELNNLNKGEGHEKNLFKDVIEKAYGTIEYRYDKTIELIVEGGNQYIWGQEKILSFLFKSLIENSFIHGFADQKTGIIKIKVKVLNEGYEVYYCDNGIGTGNFSFEQLTQPFFSTKQYKGHLGLGLFIVREVVSLYYGGYLEILESNEEGFMLKIFFQSIL